MAVEIFMDVYVNKMIKNQRHAASLYVRARFCSYRSTCMETVGVNMIWSMLIIIGIYAVIVGMLIMWNNEPTTRGKK